jgi:hypothetical protein
MNAKETSDDLFRLLSRSIGNCPESLKRAKNGKDPAFAGMKRVERQIPGLGFFPGGDGLWKEPGRCDPLDLSPRSIMVVGSTFGCLKYFEELLQKKPLAEENCRTGTWGPLLSLLGNQKNRCFFTNAFPGLLIGEENIDNDLRPVDFDPVFLGQCRHFFSKQVELIKPKAVLFLGKLSPFVLGEERLAELGWLPFVNRKRGCISKFRSLDRSGKSFVPRSVWKGVRNEVGIALLLHPSNRGRNLPNRELKYPDADPEIPFLDDVLRTTHPDISLD